MSPNQVVDVFVLLIAAGGPVALSVMGVLLSLHPPTTGLQTWSWLSAFAVIGTMSAVVSAYQLRSTERLQKELLSEVTGGEGYCYVTIESFKPNPEYAQLILFNPMSFPQNEVAVGVHTVPDPDPLEHGGQWRFGMLPPGPAPLPNLTQGGDYLIDITRFNGTFTEDLHVEKTHDDFTATIKLYRASTHQTIFSSSVKIPLIPASSPPPSPRKRQD